MFVASKAVALQRELGRFALIQPLELDRVEIVAGLDVGYRKSLGYAVALAYDVRNQREVCWVAVSSEVEIPYVPGLLAFREAPLMVAALKELVEQCTEIDVVMVNGHGLAHPRRAGIATHIGLALDMPSIGIAKKKLFGDLVEENGRVAIYVEKQKVGYVVEYRGAKTFVTVGHRVDPDTALELALRIWREGARFPEPIELADKVSKKVAKELG